VLQNDSHPLHLRPAILIFCTGPAMSPQAASHATVSQNLPKGLGLLLAAMFFPGMRPSSASEAPHYSRGRGASAVTFDEVPHYSRGEGVTMDLAHVPGGGPVDLSNREPPTVVSVGLVQLEGGRGRDDIVAALSLDCSAVIQSPPARSRLGDLVVKTPLSRRRGRVTGIDRDVAWRTVRHLSERQAEAADEGSRCDLDASWGVVGGLDERLLDVEKAAPKPLERTADWPLPSRQGLRRGTGGASIGPGLPGAEAGHLRWLVAQPHWRSGPFGESLKCLETTSLGRGGRAAARFGQVARLLHADEAFVAIDTSQGPSRTSRGIC